MSTTSMGSPLVAGLIVVAAIVLLSGLSIGFAGNVQF